MNYYTPDQLAYGMRGQAQQMGGAASISLSVVRTALQHNYNFELGVAANEKRSITKFARANGFEYLSLTMRDGKPICNFWRVPDA